MNIIVIFFSLVFFVGCQFSEENILYGKNEKKENVWICHNPQSKNHGLECEVDQDQHNCLSPGDRSAFCWLLQEQDCVGDIVHEWQHLSCHFFLDSEKQDE